MCAPVCNGSYSMADWCEPCRKAYDDWVEKDYAAYCEGERAAAFYAITPASDTEWQRHLDETCPLVGSQATEFRKLRLRPMKPGQPLPRLQPPTLDSL